MSYDIYLLGSNGVRDAIGMEARYERAIAAFLEESPEYGDDPVVGLGIASWLLPLDLREIEQEHEEFCHEIEDEVYRRLQCVRCAFETGLSPTEPLSIPHAAGLKAVLEVLKDGLVMFNGFPYTRAEDALEELERYLAGEVDIDEDVLPCVWGALGTR